MTSSKSRRENAWKMRKQNQQPHGKIKSLAQLADEAEAEAGRQSPQADD